ncbi:MAG: malate synthase, partial [Nitrososphaerota archaeon]|nr:malate synthase [Nitrososphaerota archaeon]
MSKNDLGPFNPNPSKSKGFESGHTNSVRALVRDDVAKMFPELFGTREIANRKLNVEELIGLLQTELGSDLEKVLAERHRLLEAKIPTREKYTLPKWDDAYEDPVSGKFRTFREITQGLIDNFLGDNTGLAWRLNDDSPVPDVAHPLKNPGLELTGPWHPLDMAIKQINADVSATMGPDDEDAAPADYVPSGISKNQPVGLFASRNNERLLSAGVACEVTVTKKGESKKYRIEKPRDEWPTSFHRVPGIHLRTTFVSVNGEPACATIVDYVIHALNDYGSLTRAGKGLYYYQPKIQRASEALIVGKIVWKLEQLLGATKPGTIIKFKALYEEGSLGVNLPVVMWMWRYWLIGTNVGRWDYTGALIEMWKDERVLPDPQNGSLMGMVAPHMMAYQKYNALINLMAGMKDGKLTTGAPVGGMAAVMLYPEGDPYGRNRHNPVTLRAMKMDKLRERLIGLIFVPEKRLEQGQVTLRDIIDGRVRGKLHDTWRQSWVATPDKDYVAAGNGPMRIP